MNITVGQLLVFFAGVWAFIVLWPQLGMHFAELLSRHAYALSGLYRHVRIGARCYVERFMERDLVGTLREIKASDFTMRCGVDR